MREKTKLTLFAVSVAGCVVCGGLALFSYVALSRDFSPLVVFRIVLHGRGVLHSAIIEAALVVFGTPLSLLCAAVAIYLGVHCEPITGLFKRSTDRTRQAASTVASNANTTIQPWASVASVKGDAFSKNVEKATSGFVAFAKDAMRRGQQTMAKPSFTDGGVRIAAPADSAVACGRCGQPEPVGQRFCTRCGWDRGLPSR